MPLRQGAKNLYREFTKGVSYKSGDIGDRLIDAQNFIIVKNKLQTRPGLKKLNSAAIAQDPQSLSYYQTDADVREVLVKAGTIFQKASTDDGVFTDLLTGLSSANIHNAITVRSRHIIAIGSDDMHSYDGTNIADLGVIAPGVSTVAAAAGGSLTDKTYVVVVNFESSSTGFLSNQSVDSAEVATSGGNNTIDVTAIPVSTHPLVTHKNVYLKNVTDSGAYLFVVQLVNATTTTSITANPSTAAASPPTGKDPPLSGGAKYLALFNAQILSAGNSNFLSDVFFSNVDEPDGWSTDNRLVHVHGNGPLTGIAVGHFTGNDLNQYGVFFKRRSLTIYFQSISDATDDQQIEINGVGCVSHKTIIEKDGDVVFLSDGGWRVVSNGKLVSKTLGDGEIDDIFRLSGFTYEVNKQAINNAFSVYYNELDSYMSWVPEGGSTSFDKCYNYHVDLNEWMPLRMSGSSCAIIGEDKNGEETVYVGNTDNNIYTYNIRNKQSDDITTQGFILDISKVDIDKLQGESASSIPVFCLFNWQPNSDFESTYNFRDLIIEGIGDDTSAKSAVTVKVFLGFSRTIVHEFSYNFFAVEGFTLDVSMLDVDILGDDRTRFRAVADINKTSENILIGIFQDVIEAKLQLLAYQLSFSKNGNRN